MHGRSRALISFALAGLLLATSYASAQSPEPPAVAATPPTATADQKKQARKDLADGQRLLRNKSYEDALARFQAAHLVDPSAAALRGIADAQLETKRLVEAYGSYELLLATYGGELKEKEKTAAEAALARLAAETGSLKLSVSPPDAAVKLDAQAVPAEAASRAIRVLPGGHDLAASKQDFEPFASRVEVQPGKETPVEIQLKPEVKTGHVRVSADAAPLGTRVLVDGKDVGPSPWEGDLDPGPHEFQAAGPNLKSEKTSTEVALKSQLVIALETSLELPAPPPVPVAIPAPIAPPAPPAAVAPAASITTGSVPAASPSRSAVQPGLLLGILSLPRPAQIELAIKLGTRAAIGAQYSMLPTLTVPGKDAELKLSALQATARWFPFAGAFYLGAGVGYQQLRGSLTETVDGGKLSVVADLSGAFVAPQLGWIWIWESGFSLGINLGAQIPLPKDPVVTMAYNGQPIPDQAGPGFPAAVVDAAHDGKEQVQSVAKIIMKYPIPNIELLKIGFFF